MKNLIEDIGDFLVVWEPGDYAVNFKVYAIEARLMSGDGVPAHNGSGVAEFESAAGDGQSTIDREKAQTFMTGFFKWDCCCHVYPTNDKDIGSAYWHFDGPEGFDRIRGLFTYLQKTAPAHIKKADDILWGLS